MNELIQKHKSILKSIQFKYLKTKLKFLDVLVFNSINNKLQTTLYKTDRLPNLFTSKLGTPEIIKRKHNL